jgi:protein-S-isoprenylcysteine O-methyltransferase Ste14
MRVTPATALAAFAMIGVVGAWLPASCDHKEIWTLDDNAVRWLGVVVFTLGRVLRMWP